jgi:type IV secretory pathway TrbD component
MNDDLRRVPVHRSLTRHQLLAGCDRTLFFALLLFGLLLVFSGVMSGYFRNILFAVALWLMGIPVLAKLAVYDDHFKDIVICSIRYTQADLPACGQIGSHITGVHHRRWD